MHQSMCVCAGEQYIAKYISLITVMKVFIYFFYRYREKYKAFNLVDCFFSRCDVRRDVSGPEPAVGERGVRDHPPQRALGLHPHRGALSRHLLRQVGLGALARAVL